MAAASGWRAGTSPGCRPIAAARSDWRARSRSPRCCRILPPRTMSRLRRRRMTGTRSGSGATAGRGPPPREPARAALERVGLGARAGVLVSRLSHGEQRELELAVALATKPQLLLLDEPMAGLGITESARMVKLLQELRREVSIVLVEHDMNAVFALADRISVMVYGRVIASGSPAEIRSNDEVK